MTMTRAFNALSLEEEQHLLLSKAHLVLAAKSRLDHVGESEAAVGRANGNLDTVKRELQKGIESASSAALADRATMLIVLTANGMALRHCSPALKADPDLILAACSDNGYMLELASEELQNDRDFVLRAVRLDGFALDAASSPLAADREVVLAAVTSEPFALQHASDDLKRDRDLVLAALKSQTRRHFFEFDRNVLTDLFEDEDISDRELLLEAARVDGGVAACASLELKQDKDFLLEVMRRAPSEDQERCYMQADASVVASISFESFQGACDSVLALAGEDAIVLIISMLPRAMPAADDDCQSSCPPPLTCRVHMISGTSFNCSLDQAGVGSGGGDAEDPDLRAASATSLTVGRLAALVHADLPEHIEVDPIPPRIFIVFTKMDAEGQELSVPTSPWDWNRPVSDFC